MFTGIIQHIGAVRSIRPGAGGARLRVDLGPLAEGLAPGDSVAVSGACLTAVGIEGPEVEFDVVDETLRRTTLGALRSGDGVNLERSLRLGGSLDGHLVQGHVDGVAHLRSSQGRQQRMMEFAAPPELTAQLVPKGSVAIDGVSLTLVDVEGGRFTVAIIPATIERTTLGALRSGDGVNIETDVIGKYVLRYLRQLGAGGGGGLTLEKLKEAGFADNRIDD